MPDYSVKIPFKGKDNVSSAISRMRSNINTLGRDSKSIFKHMGKDALSVKKVIGGILGAKAITSGIAFAKRGVTALTEEMIKLDSASVAAAARFGFDREAAGFKKITDEARAVGAVTRYTAGEAAEAIDFFAKAGYNLDDSLKLVAPTAKLAQSAGLDLATTADIASDSLGAFGLKVDQYKSASDILAFTANSTNTTLEEMFDTIKMGGPVVKLAGGDISTFSSLIRPMASAGIKGTLAATALKNAMLNMTAGTGAAKDEMKKLKIKTADNKGNLLDILDIMGQLETKFNKMGSSDKIKSMSNIFGKRAIAGMSAVFDQGIKTSKEFGKATVSELREQARNASGYVDQQAERMSKSYENKLLSIKSALVEIGFVAIDALGKNPGKYLDILIKKIREVNPKDVIQKVKSFISTIKTIMSTIKALIPVVKVLVSAWIGYKLIMGGIIALHTVRHLNNIRIGLLDCATNTKNLTGNLRGAGKATRNLNGNIDKSISKTERWGVGVAAVLASLEAGYELGKWLNEKFVEPHSQEQADKYSKSQNVADKYSPGSTKYGQMSKEEIEKGIKEIDVAIANAIGSYSSAENIAGELASVFTDVESPSDRIANLTRDLATKKQTLEYFKQEIINSQKIEAIGKEKGALLAKIVKNNENTLMKIRELENTFDNPLYGSESNSLYSNGQTEAGPVAKKLDVTNKVKVDSTVSFDNAPKGVGVKTKVTAPPIDRQSLGVN